ncbi:MAG TPA: inositol monophosphatase family protein [Actinomycetota bacterium]|nr:inositol monophosphatase family protein [Actinomycetota bacterium]
MYEDDLAFAHDLADAAGEIAMGLFLDEGLEIRHKADRTLVTQADTGIERLVRERLTGAFPSDRIMGEEEGGTFDGAGRVWIVDPIDGTANYARGIPVWATLIALQVDGELVVGVANAPAIGERYAAARGEGATMNGKRISVSDIATIAEAQFLYSQLDMLLGGAHGSATLELLAGSNRERGFGDFWGHLLVARGAAEICVEPSLAIWDYAALVPIVEEAGGRITDFAGKPPRHKGSVLTTNGVMHAELLRRLRG